MSSKRHQFTPLSSSQTISVEDDAEIVNIERMMIQMDNEESDPLLDNELYYISGFIVRSLLPKQTCENCRSELLLDPEDPMALKMANYPLISKQSLAGQKEGLIFPSPAVLRIIKATEVIFMRMIIESDKGIVFEKKVDLKLQSAVLKQLVIDIFNASSGHFFDHQIGQESDHLSSLFKKHC